MAEINKDLRASSYDDPVVCCFELMSEKPTPLQEQYMKNAVFIVHGMGAHESGPTAVVLRQGFEDALEKLRAKDPEQRNGNQSWKRTPATYLMEGYWGDYGEFKDSFPTLYKKMNDGSRNFFSRLWKARTKSHVRTAIWFGTQATRLPLALITQGWISEWGKAKGWHKAAWPFYRLFRVFFYTAVAITVWIGLLVLLGFQKGKEILSSVLGDVRFYLAPSGPVEQAIVQRIDCHIRDMFLRLLGLDADLEELPDAQPPLRDQTQVRAQITDPEMITAAGKGATKITANIIVDKIPPSDANPEHPTKITIGGARHVFEKVTWVAHSLGTIVSYNVISDILKKCKEVEAQCKDPSKYGLSQEQVTELSNGVKRVKNGLHRFYTMGSPLRKVSWLFPNVLREWDHEYAKEITAANGETVDGDKKHWWINIRHVWDPVSGFVTGSPLFPEAEDSHSTKILTLPGLAHISYWHTDSICQYIMTQAQPEMPLSRKIPVPDRGWVAKLCWNVSFIFLFLLVFEVVIKLVYTLGLYAGWPLRKAWDWLIKLPLVGTILEKIWCLLSGFTNCWKCLQN